VAVIAFNLPGGRGVLQGQDGAVIQAEQIRKRAAELPSMDALFLSNVHPNAIDGTPSVNAGKAVLSPIVETTRGLRASYGRIIITAGVAGTFAQISLYRLQDRGEMQLKMVAGSTVTFDCTTTGVKTVALAKPVDILPNYRYYIGTFTSNAAIRFAGATTMQYWLLSRIMIAAPASGLPETVDITEATKYMDDKVYLMSAAYLSEFGKMVL